LALVRTVLDRFRFARFLSALWGKSAPFLL